MSTVSAPASELLLQHLASIQFTISGTGFIVDTDVNNPSSMLQPDDLTGSSVNEVMAAESAPALTAKPTEARRDKGTAVRVDSTPTPPNGTSPPGAAGREARPRAWRASAWRGPEASRSRRGIRVWRRSLVCR